MDALRTHLASKLSCFTFRPPSEPFSAAWTISVVSNVDGVLYPAGGLEGHLGPLGVRFDIGDEWNFNSGAHNNLRIAFGPYIHF
jgi:hypothetical protein